MKENLALQALLRFSRYPHYLEELVKFGKIRFNHVSTHIPTEKGEESKRWDKHEGTTYLNQPESTKIVIDGHPFKLAEPHPSRFTDISHPYVYCMCGITNEAIKQRRDGTAYSSQLWEDFGEYVVLIHDTSKFKERIDGYLTNQGIALFYSPINYIEKSSYSGTLDMFNKMDSYRYQQEYRLAINPKIGGLYYDIEIGDISDIAYGPVHMSKCKNKVVDDILHV